MMTTFRRALCVIQVCLGVGMILASGVYVSARRSVVGAVSGQVLSTDITLAATEQALLSIKQTLRSYRTVLGMWAETASALTNVLPLASQNVRDASVACGYMQSKLNRVAQICRRLPIVGDQLAESVDALGQPCGHAKITADALDEALRAQMMPSAAASLVALTETRLTLANGETVCDRAVDSIKRLRTQTGEVALKGTSRMLDAIAVAVLLTGVSSVLNGLFFSACSPSKASGVA